jgi:hypothetical protein
LGGLPPQKTTPFYEMILSFNLFELRKQMEYILIPKGFSCQPF